MCNMHFILTLTPPWLQVKAAKYFDFGNLDVWRVAVCVRFSSETTWPISPIMIPINWGNNLDVQRALNFDLDPSMTACQGHKILQFCEFRFLTGSSLCLLLLRNYLTKFSNADANLQREQCRFVDLQHILNFDLHPSMTAGQGHNILWFCEFLCLMGSSLCSILLRNYSTDFSNADTNLSSENCRFATYTSFWPSPLHDCRSRSQNTSIL